MITIPDFWTADKNDRLLVVSLGNTRARFGWFDGDLRVAIDSVSTRELQQHPPPPPPHGPIVVVSVVPAATDALLEAWHGLPVRVLTASTSGLTIHYDPPESMGADRLANTLALGERGKRPAIAVDCGTATTFTVVDAAGVVVGGAIAPGLGTAANALIGNAAQLPPIPLEHCPDPWGTNTVASLQLGMVEGHVGMIRHLVERFQAGLGGNAEVVLCGGWSGLLAERLSDYAWVPELTLEGGRVFGRKASLAAG